MEFKNVLIWLRSHLVELIFLVLVVLLLVAFLAWAATSQAKGFFEQHSLKGELATDMEAFYASVRNGRDQAMAGRQRVGVEVTPKGWRIYADTGGVPWHDDPQDQPLNSGRWQSGLKFGSNLPGVRFFFTGDGLCHASENTVCLEEDWSQPEKEVHALAFTSSARRIYTLTFGKDGRPDLAQDDF
jgi:hypothetical protein